MMEFRALGSLSVRRDGQPLALGGPKQRMVLALLLMNANRAISVDRLIDGVWGDDAPNAARHTLQSYVSELRKVLDDQLKREGMSRRGRPRPARSALSMQVTPPSNRPGKSMQVTPPSNQPGPSSPCRSASRCIPPA